jgi:putative sterol carrier protein
LVSDQAKDGVPPEFLEDPDRYFLEWIPGILRNNLDANKHFGKVQSVAQFHLTGERGGWWHFVLGNGDVVVSAGEHARPGFTLTMAVETWRRLNRGEVTGLRAWLRGDVKITGSKLQFLRVARLFG